MSVRSIEIRGAATHNLVYVDVSIPHAAITVITGVSGSGKSSLAIDTLYAEGQRRFVQSLSAYARQFMDRLARPPFERIDNIPPAIAIGQTSQPKSARATVGAMSEMSDLLQLLWAAQARAFCPDGHGEILPSAPSSARAALVEAHAGAKALIVAPIDASATAQVVSAGWTRTLEPGGAIGELTADRPASAAGGYRVIVDRLVVKDSTRLAESIAAAMRITGGAAEVHLPARRAVLRFDQRLVCDVCGFAVPPRTARLFSASSPLGACAECQGFGKVAIIDPEKVVPDPTRTLLKDAIAPWSTPTRASEKSTYHQLAAERGLRLNVPWQALSDAERALVWDGAPELGFRGVEGFFARQAQKRYKMSARILIARYRGYTECRACEGRRFAPPALAYQIDGRSIADAHATSIDALAGWVTSQTFDPATNSLVDQIARRLALLNRVGLGYLTLIREGRSLSAGEARRVHLCSALSAGVTGTLYVLDEPSIGLHPRDTRRLIDVLRQLADTGNTVVVVEHDTDIIRAADAVIELGPGAGRHGGNVVFTGPPAEIEGTPTATGRALAGPAEGCTLTRFAGLAADASLIVRGAGARTLKRFDARIPLGALTCITGVSGSGKSTFLHEVLAGALRRALGGAGIDPRVADGFEGLEAITEVAVVDTSPLSRSVRSIPATYLGAWTPIRNVLASSPDARRLGLAARDFSFNSRGRCSECNGIGSITVDMQFMADVETTCEACDGKRFASRVLEARYQGQAVDQILAMSVAQADEVFGAHPDVRRRLKPMLDVGLGYLCLGQATSTLSGGEAQRLKLAAHLARRGRAKTLLLLDEPTTGLHVDDVGQLLAAFGALLDRGATIVVVEHHLEVIRHAHHVIDLGPEGGASGGEVLVAGSIFDLLACDASHTGKALAEHLGQAPRPVHRRSPTAATT